VELLLGTPRAAAVRQAIGSAELVVADLVDAEALSVLRRLERSGQLTAERAQQAVDDLEQAPLRRFPTQPLIAPAWELRKHVSTYDAFHVGLARTLGCPLVTGDLRLARAPGLDVTVVAV
jgi:predicted nucleic acid-binding protein